MRTANRGSLFTIIGLALAILTAFVSLPANSQILWIVVVMFCGGITGYAIAQRVQMKNLPQLIAAFHSLIGLAAVCIDTAIFVNPATLGITLFDNPITKIEVALGIVVGAVTFSGSLVAFLKLQGITKYTPNLYITNIVLCTVLLISMVMFVCSVNINVISFLLLISLATVLGYTIIVPIGGADMPVIVSMLNSCSGWAATGVGLTFNNYLLVITGILVGTSGAILSNIMCKGMHRKLSQVILVGFKPQQKVSVVTSIQNNVRLCSPDEAVYILEHSNSVVIVPGYGMAVSQAQHAIKDVLDKLLASNIDVKFALHPVAGRMPGHMNVLLAEAHISDDYVYDLDNINHELSSVDTVIVVGANDTVNASAKDDTKSPIYGMPVIEVWKAKTVIVVKRTLNTGYAGIDNPLFYKPNTLMLLGDAKKVMNEIAKELK